MLIFCYLFLSQQSRDKKMNSHVAFHPFIAQLTKQRQLGLVETESRCYGGKKHMIKGDFQL